MFPCWWRFFCVGAYLVCPSTLRLCFGLWETKLCTFSICLWVLARWWSLVAYNLISFLWLEILILNDSWTSGGGHLLSVDFDKVCVCVVLGHASLLWTWLAGINFLSIVRFITIFINKRWVLLGKALFWLWGELGGISDHLCTWVPEWSLCRLDLLKWISWWQWGNLHLMVNQVCLELVLFRNSASESCIDTAVIF